MILFRLLLVAAILITNVSVAFSNDEKLLIPKSEEIPKTFEAVIHVNEKLENKIPEYVSFNLPLPKNILTSPTNLSFHLQNSKSIHAETKVVQHWYTLDGKPNSIRSLNIRIKNSKEYRFPLPIKIKLETTDSNKTQLNNSLKSRWVKKNIKLKNEKVSYNISIKEPEFYATYSPDWLGLCLFRTRTIPINKNTKLKWFDQAFLNYTSTLSMALNEPEKPHEFKLADFSAWMFDLPSTLFNLYIKTGEIKWLKQAHMTSQIYAYFINEQGHWTMKPKPDFKYSYNLSMNLDYILIGDEELLPKIQSVASYQSNWREDYKRSYTFWTERHLNYAFSAALTAWEANSDPKHLNRAKNISNAISNEINYPESPWRKVGCLQHEIEDHAGWAKPHLRGKPVCSPWMSAILADTLIRYYIHTFDEVALKNIFQLSSFIVNQALYINNKGKGKVLGDTTPHYLVFTAEVPDSGGNPWGDRQHACDVAGLIVKGIWAGKQLGESVKQLRKPFKNLLSTCQEVLTNGMRKSKLYGQKYWALKPPRKYSWWFGTTSDLTYLYD